MTDLLNSGTPGKLPSIHVDPFKKDCIKDIDIHMTSPWIGNGAPYWWATVAFKNGNTEGKQKFDGYKVDEFERLIRDIQNFINSL